MNERFEVGEIAIYQNFDISLGINGREVLILDGLAVRTGRNRRTGEISTHLCYLIQDRMDGRLLVQPQYLRKKRPPREDLQIVRWADCPWQPEKVRA